MGRVREGQRGGGAEAADRVEEATDDARVAGEDHLHTLALVLLAIAGPRHLALLSPHDLVAVWIGLARPHEEHLLAHRVAARQRLRARENLGVDVARFIGACVRGGGPQACVPLELVRAAASRGTRHVSVMQELYCVRELRLAKALEMSRDRVEPGKAERQGHGQVWGYLGLWIGSWAGARR